MNELDQSRLKWRKSSRSGGQQECIELAAYEGRVAIRDSKEHGKGGVLLFTAAEAAAFVQAVKNTAV